MPSYSHLLRSQLMKRFPPPMWFLVATIALFVPRISVAQTNIIQIIADDLGWADLSNGLTNLGNGSPYYQTPHIDSLAAGGMSFTSFYAQPSCAPTRAALFTGQYAPRNGLHTVGQLNDGGDATLLIGPTDGTSIRTCLLYTSPSPRDQRGSRMPSSA